MPLEVAHSFVFVFFASIATNHIILTLISLANTALYALFSSKFKGTGTFPPSFLQVDEASLIWPFAVRRHFETPAIVNLVHSFEHVLGAAAPRNIIRKWKLFFTRKHVLLLRDS